MPRGLLSRQFFLLSLGSHMSVTPLDAVPQRVRPALPVFQFNFPRQSNKPWLCLRPPSPKHAMRRTHAFVCYSGMSTIVSGRPLDKGRSMFSVLAIYHLSLYLKMGGRPSGQLICRYRARELPSPCANGVGSSFLKMRLSEEIMADRVPFAQGTRSAPASGSRRPPRPGVLYLHVQRCFVTSSLLWVEAKPLGPFVR